MTREENIQYYRSLTEKEKLIVRYAIVAATNFEASTLWDISFETRRMFTRKEIDVFLQTLLRKGIINDIRTWYQRYNIDTRFLIHIFPLMKDYENEIRDLISGRASSYYFGISHQVLLRDTLYALVFEDKKKYLEKELDIVRNISEASLVSYYTEIVEDDDYLPYLHKITPALLEKIANARMGHNLFYLKPFSESKRFFDRISSYINLPLISPLLSMNEYYFGGQFDKALAHAAAIPLEELNGSHYLPALKLLSEGHIEESLKLFDRGLKSQRKMMKGHYLPYGITMALAYIIALLRIDSNVSTPIFQRILKSFKQDYPFGYHLLNILIRYSIGNGFDPQRDIKYVEAAFNEDNITGLIALQVYYLCDFKTTDRLLLERFYTLIEKAEKAGFLLSAQEAAYALHAIYQLDETGKFYRRIAAKVDYEPFISQVVRIEEWEKSLNLLMSLQAPTALNPNNDTGASARVVYFFNPKYKSVQPVLQNRQGKGWSKGRNIAMKTLFEGNVKNMTEQDLRISKTMNSETGHYSQNYSFKETVFRELIGHPYIFLDGADAVPVEFVKGKPLVVIEKKNKDYMLSTNIGHLHNVDKIHIEKETNTRYVVYDLSKKQLDILHIIKDKKIKVPEAGKEKLKQLLGVLNTQDVEIHSDLSASDNTERNIENVAPDSIIRVQLLPFGDGLKAELFSKPFGGYPPYCKPGKGGKVLLRNGENNVQYQVKRDITKEQENEALLMNDIQSLESINIQDGLIAFAEPMESLYLLDILKKHSDICIVEWPEGERFRIRGKAGFENLKLSLKSKTNWFELQGELAIDENTVLSLGQLLALTEKGHGRFIELAPGEFLALSNELKKRLDDLRMFSSAGKKEVAVNKFASVALDGLFDNMHNLKADKKWKEFRQRLKDINTDDTPVPATLQADLRPYQEEGFRWMARLSQWEAGACLADDMGLGKTVQTLAILLQRASLGAALVVSPVSVIGNWLNEISRFAPSLNIKTFGNGNRKQTLDELQPGDVLVTSYGLLQSEEKLFREPEFATIVLDEAHTIKNFATKTSKAAMQLNGLFRIVLTGTPLQNHLGEIWNLFNFINPGLLGDLNRFTERFVKPENDSARERLKKLISPFILRRTKAAVLDELPPKTEIVKKIRLSDTEMAFYETLRRQALENISNNADSNGAKQMQVLAEITRLRQACCNPQLIDKNTQIPSAKLSTFLETVDELVENKHRALVFSQFVKHLSIVRKALDKKKISYQYLDGSTPIAEREKSVKAFQSGEGQLFLISLKAGGLGLNLTGADFVIHLDPWWNPAIEDQASDRAHRIGQKRPVTIYRLVAENTIEEKIIKLHGTKRDLAETLLEGSDQSARLSMKDLMELIKENT